MYRHRGGKQIISKFVMRTLHRTDAIFYKLDGEGLRYEIAAFSRAIQNGVNTGCMDEKITASISSVMEQFYDKECPNHDFIS